MTRRPLRIVLVEFSPSGGLFHFSFQMGAALAEEGHEVTLLTGPEPEMTSTVQGFEVVPLLPTWHPGGGVEPLVVRKVRRVFRGGRHVAAWIQVARFVRDLEPDVLQWSEWRFAVDGLAASAVAHRGWAQVCISLAHSPIPIEEQRAGSGAYRTSRVLYGALGRGYRAMDGVLVLGQQSRSDLLRAWPKLPSVQVIPHGDQRAFAREEWPDPGGCPEEVVLFGSLTGYKGIDVLLDAFAMVRAERPGASLRIAGPVMGDLDVDGMARRASAMAGVEFRPGYIPADEVPGLVGGARLVVAPYTRSNASGAVRLAQTLARPVVVTDVGDLADSVDDGETGFVVPAGDPARLARAIVRLLEEPELATGMGLEGRRRLFEDSSWEVVAGRLDGVYRSLLGGRGRVPLRPESAERSAEWSPVDVRARRRTT